ncbi:MAG: class II fructose-bisphosphate aldolase [Candidatus Borkfalkiaceae bacterium]|nr:class II fructose-bisphosphate aldolase [Christensenellaceae bacterium]
MLVNLNEVLKKAQKEKYAVGLFNTTDTDMLQAVIEAAEESNSPVILGTAEVLLPYGELKLIAPSVIAAAKRAKVPVVVHYDHGLTFDRCIEALKLGFSSIMFDGSAKPYEQNIAETREMVKIAHAFGATVEGEIGHVGEAAKEDNLLTDMYTTPEEAKVYLEATGVDALAVAIGSAHGVYKKKPMLNIERLKEISGKIKVPLVLHGGSGLSDDDFKNTIRNGIAKVNIFTDLCLAGERAMKDGEEKKLGYLETRNLKVDYIKEAVKHKMALFGSVNKA